MFKPRVKSTVIEEPTSSFEIGRASIVKKTTQQQQNETEIRNERVSTSSSVSTLSTLSSSSSSSKNKHKQNGYENNIIGDQPITIESMSAVIAAAVQMSSTPGSKSSLSMGHASILPNNNNNNNNDINEPSNDLKKKKRFSLFSWKRQSISSVNNINNNNDVNLSSSLSSSSSSTISSTSSSSSPNSPTDSPTNMPNTPRSSLVDDGLDELAYRGIQIKEIKTTLKPMVIPSTVTNPMPTVKLERPGFARINY